MNTYFFLRVKKLRRLVSACVGAGKVGALDVLAPEVPCAA